MANNCSVLCFEMFTCHVIHGESIFCMVKIYVCLNPFFLCVKTFFFVNIILDIELYRLTYSF